MNHKQNGFIGVVIVFAALILGGGYAGYYFVLKDKDKAPTEDPTLAGQADTTTAEERDDTRKDHATSLASGLFSQVFIVERVPSQDQAGLDLINSFRLKDPSTNKAYTYNDDQNKMVVGEAYFRVAATCDDKTDPSQKGIIIDGPEDSIAIALKLEDGTYACESSI